MKPILIVLFLGFFTLFPGHRAVAALTEGQKIDLLISYVKNLDGAVFIRNGTPHSPAEAAAHMQMKREKAPKYARTAEDFIQHLASKSSFSGKPYYIRFKDGKTVLAEEVLKKELQRILSQR
jgi:hypothetical protein